MQAALAGAESKDVSSLDPALTINLDAVGTLVIPAGVTLCGGRNEDIDGAVLTAQLADGDTWPLLVSGGPDVRLERMRLIGPSASTTPINKYGRGIAILHPGAVGPNMTLRRLRFYDQATETEAPQQLESDVNGDGRADLVSAHTNSYAYVWPGLASGHFGRAVASFAGTLNSNQHDRRGHEFVMEKKMIRRNGCWSDGCIP